jgi:GPH family glycoside/pentoside/hexuronide:cation symporter
MASMKQKEIRLLSHGLFEKPFMDSKVTSRSVSTKEKILG